jgi:hypothetical protein
MPGTLCSPRNDNLYATAATRINCSRCLKLLVRNEDPSLLVKRRFAPTARYPEEGAHYQGDQAYRELHEMVVGGREGKHGRRLQPGDATRATASAAWTRELESGETYPEARTQPKKTVEEGGPERVATTDRVREEANEAAFSEWLAAGQKGKPPKAWQRRKRAKIRRSVRIEDSTCYKNPMIHLRKNPVHYLTPDEADALAESEDISRGDLLSPTGPYRGRLEVLGASASPSAARALLPLPLAKRSRKPSTRRGKGYEAIQQKGQVQVGPDAWAQNPWIITYNGYAMERPGGRIAWAGSLAKAMSIVKKLRAVGRGPMEVAEVSRHQMSHNARKKLFGS